MRNNKITRIFSSPVAAYLLLVAALTLSNEVVASQMLCKGLNHFAAHLHRLMDALLLALPVLLVPRRWLALPWLVVVHVYWLANLWYYRNFGTFIPQNQLLRFSDLQGLGGSIVESMRWIDLLVAAPSVVWCVWFCCMRMRRQRLAAGLIGVAVVGFAIGVIVSDFQRFEPGDKDGPKRLYSERFSRAYRTFGLTDYWVVQAMMRQRCTAEELAEVERWMAQREEPAYETQSAEGKNLIVVVVESLASWQVGLQVEGVPVTPRMDALIADSATLYMPNCLTQVHLGRSSDCHLMLETGLMPMQNEAASIVAASNQYFALPKALKENGYHSVAYVCDSKKASWLQATNYASYGYDEVVDKLGLTRKSSKWDSCDQFLFPRVMERLPKLEEPFYAKVVTLSMHDSKPLPGHPTKLKECDFPSQELEHFLVRTHYTDSLLGLFLDSLRAVGLYERSLIVITGDHYKYTGDEYFLRPQRPEDLCVPLLILNAPARPENPQMWFGQMDLYPTLLDLMGLRSYPWRGLGTSLLSPAHEGTYDYLLLRAPLSRLSDIILRSDYFRR